MVAKRADLKHSQHKKKKKMALKWCDEALAMLSYGGHHFTIYNCIKSIGGTP